MNRVVINMDEQGCFEIFSDEPIEFFVVNDHCPQDRVYQMSVEIGVDKVRGQLRDDVVGHAGDEFFETRSGYGKKPPSRRKLKVVE
jgi:hypothetical protein